VFPAKSSDGKSPPDDCIGIPSKGLIQPACNVDMPEAGLVRVFIAGLESGHDATPVVLSSGSGSLDSGETGILKFHVANGPLAKISNYSAVVVVVKVKTQKSSPTVTAEELGKMLGETATGQKPSQATLDKLKAAE
jgi:hypothetical protein